MSKIDKFILDSLNNTPPFSVGAATNDLPVVGIQWDKSNYPWKLQIWSRKYNRFTNTYLIEAQDIPNASIDSNGLMTVEDKAKLDSISDNWSLDEIDTGATFIDGKKIYSRTIDCGALPNNNTKVVSHSIANVDNFIEIGGFFTNGTLSFPFPYCSPNLTSNIGVYASKTELMIVTGKDMTTYNGTIKLKYTCTDR
jgi:hypothetical protein